MPEHPATWNQSVMMPISGVPATAVNAVQTLSITGGPPTTLTLRLRKDGVPTAAITWSNNNTTLLANINAALNAAFGTGNLVATAGTVTAGIGTILITAAAKLAGLVLSTMTVEKVSETGTATTLGLTTTTAGVTATARDARTAALLASDNGNVYRNSSTTPNAPTWVAI